MSGRYLGVPNVEPPGEKKYLRIQVPAAFQLIWSARCRELGIPQATYLQRLFEHDNAPAPRVMSAVEYAAFRHEQDEDARMRAEMEDAKKSWLGEP